ncbi:MAG TPA: hypothetical protein VHE99_01405 [Gammaproteobacteria bacterium]|nr:hypothetical protein [Gammaproteobacteria bacterium]
MTYELPSSQLHEHFSTIKETKTGQVLSTGQDPQKIVSNLPPQQPEFHFYSGILLVYRIDIIGNLWHPLPWLSFRIYSR